jgi:zinc protease
MFAPYTGRMVSVSSRLSRFVLSVLVGFSLLIPAAAQVQSVAPKPKRAPVTVKEPLPATPWLYRGSDIPPDPEWVFGELPNGLRYAVRKNGVPPGQVSVRVAIDAGSIMERPGEGGYAHFNEHLSFRGSKFVADEEAKRVWQRLGATFGSDTNALTSPTQTIYKLDLPSATDAGLDETVKILSGMMSGAFLTQNAVDTERRTVLAELREGTSPQRRIADATRELFFAGQPLGAGSPIGTVASLNGATAASLRAFRDRWYRPDKTVVVIAGDNETKVFEALVRKYFGDWKAPLAPVPQADFGKPDLAAPRARVLVDPGLPVLVSMAVLRPWVQKNDTVEYNRGKLIDTLATRIINRRLERAARMGGTFLQASIDQEDVSRSADGTFIQVVPIGNDWQAAIRDVRAAIGDALTNPPDQDEINREAGEFAAALQNAVDTGRTDAGGALADTLVEAVNIRETVASNEVARDVFSNMQDRLTPAAILASTRKLLSGTPMRAILSLQEAEPTAEAKLLAALDAPVTASPASRITLPVSFDRVPKLGTPAKIVSRRQMPRLDLEYVELSNGVRLVLFSNKAESNRVLVQARFGRGLQALPANKPTFAWAGEAALVSSGIGDLGQEELDRLTSARRINMGFDIGDDAFYLKATTRASDLDDQFKLLAAKLARPGWDPAPVIRAQAATRVGIATLGNSPQSVLGRDLQQLLHGGDPRWATPTREQVDALTPKAFRKLWEPLLKTGPVEVSIFGDFDREKAIAAAAATFGAMPKTKNSAPKNAGSASVQPNTAPMSLTHRGPADQAAAVLAWPTGGGLGDVYESRKLEILSQIFSDRLFDQLREAEGASYSPNVNNSWPEGMTSGGSFAVISQLRPDSIDTFFRIARAVAADLATKPVTADELARAVTPMRELIARASSGNSFWMSQLSGSSADPRKLLALQTLPSDFARITPAELQATAKRWLVPDKSFSLVVVPEQKAR